MSDVSDQSDLLHEGGWIVHSVGEYVLSVVAAGILVSICGSFFDEKSTTGTLIRVMGGLFLSFVILSPVAKWDLDAVAAFTESFDRAGEYAAEAGNVMASKEVQAIIKEELSEYILDKAAELHATVSVEITLNNDSIPIPESVKITGTIPAYAKRKLQQEIEDELGIPKERQIWIG